MAVPSLLLLSALASAGTVDRVAAVVNSDVITLSEMYDENGGFVEQNCPTLEATCVAAAEKQILDGLILQSLVEQELGERGQAITPEELDGAIGQVARDNGLPGIPELRQAVIQSGTPWETFRDGVRLQLIQLKFTEMVIRPRITINDDELLDAYNRSKSSMSEPDQRKLLAFAHPVPPEATPEEVEALRAQLVSVIGEVNDGSRDWVETVKEFDGGSYANKPEPGDMGSFVRGGLMAELDEPVWAAGVGEVIGPFRVGSSLFVLKIASEEKGGSRPLEQVADALREQIYQSKVAEEVDRWFALARRRAAVKILLDLPE